EITGYTEDDFKAGRPRWDQVIHPDDFLQLSDTSLKIATVPNSSVEREYRIIRKDGQIRWIHELIQNVCDDSAAIVGVRGMLYDITKRKRAEETLRLIYRLFKVANRHTEMNPLLSEFVTEIQAFTGCAAVGIRLLDEKGNIPYEAYRGFSQSFYESESALSIKLDQCICINVIKGEIDPNFSFYTEKGSFFINGTTRFLATVSEEEKGSTRNKCNAVGFESVALVPIFSGDQILGLIHLADYQENKVPLETVETMESVALNLATAMQRMLAEELFKYTRNSV
ncbi:MAG: PAS domain-containing protein, partial [Candidatus Hodarchaeales archaeon]